MARQADSRTALRRMSLFATILTVAGHIWLGFEQSWAQVVITLLVAYATELLLETVDARANGRAPRFSGGPASLFSFLLSSHLTGLSVALLLYTGRQLSPMVFATVAGICSKYLFRAPVDGKSRHFFNPSNFGISAALLLFPTIGVAPPYQFTANVDGVLDWAVPLVIVAIGTFLNLRFTGRMPLIFAWLAAFAGQAALRAALFATPVAAGLMPVTGLAFQLYTLYMITDPATTPSDRRGQVLFGLGVAAVYGALQLLHVVFGLFFALTIVSAVRGLWLYRAALQAPARVQPLPKGGA